MADSEESWEAWLDRHGPAALLFARQITRSGADAEDAVQDGFVRFWHHRRNARDPAALFFASVRTAALDLCRGLKRRKAREARTARARPAFAVGYRRETDRGEAIERALATLPEAQREVIVLKIWAGLTLGQIAETTGESTNTVASRYRYALEKLGPLLQAEVQHD